VERGATGYIVTPISGTHIVAGSRSESARGSSEGVSGVEVNSLPKVPTQVKRLDEGIGKARSASAGAEIGPGDVSYQLAARPVQVNVGHEISAQDLLFRNVIGDVLVHPDGIAPGDS